MPDYALPFPGRELAGKELSYDPCYAKIPEQDRERIVEAAWQKGATAARELFQKEQGQQDFFEIASKNGLRCLRLDKDYIVGNQRYFSDYLSGKNVIHLYLRSIDLWAAENGLTRGQAEQVILSHEYYHFLEWNVLGLTSRDYFVPMLEFGPLRLGKTGIRALSEIGAHAFARTYYDLCNTTTTYAQEEHHEQA